MIFIFAPLSNPLARLNKPETTPIKLAFCSGS